MQTVKSNTKEDVGDAYQTYENPLSSVPKNDFRDQSDDCHLRRRNLLLKVAIILGLMLLLASFVTMIGLHFEGQSELKTDLTAEAKQNSQKLSNVAKEIALSRNISLDLTGKTRQNSDQLLNIANKVAEVKKINLDLVNSPRSCKEVRYIASELQNETGDIFYINPSASGLAPMSVYCDVRTDGGGWMVFQRRMDGSVDFYRDWDNYANGFGDKRREFWLGLEILHHFTGNNSDHELRIDMISHNGSYFYAKYSDFSIGPSSDYYRLKATGYSGNATDSLAYQNNMKFSTKDNNNDLLSRTCSDYHTSAWWYNQCHTSDLNGPYGGQYPKGFVWRDLTDTNPSKLNWIELRFAEMKIRKKN